MLSRKQAKAYVFAHSKVVQESIRQFPPYSYIEVIFTDPHSTNPKTGKVLVLKASAAVSLYYLDEWDPELGIKIAVGKARATLARKYRAWKKRQRKKEMLAERHVVVLPIPFERDLPEDTTTITIVGV